MRVRTRVQYPVINPVYLQAAKTGAYRKLRRQARRAVKPQVSVRAAYPHCQIRLLAEVLAQCGQSLSEALQGVDTLQRIAQYAEAAFHQLLVELDEMHLAGAPEQHPGKQ